MLLLACNSTGWQDAIFECRSTHFMEMINMIYRARFEHVSAVLHHTGKEQQKSLTLPGTILGKNPVVFNATSGKMKTIYAVRSGNYIP